MFYMQLLNESVNLMKGHFLYIIFSSSVQQPENKTMKIKGPDTPDSSSDAHDIQHVDLTWIIIIKIRSRCYCGTGYRCIYLFRINQKYVELYTQKGNANTAWYCVIVFMHTTWPCICPFYIPWVIRKSLKWTEWPISSKNMIDSQSSPYFFLLQRIYWLLHLITASDAFHSISTAFVGDVRNLRNRKQGVEQKASPWNGWGDQ